MANAEAHRLSGLKLDTTFTRSTPPSDSPNLQTYRHGGRRADGDGLGEEQNDQIHGLSERPRNAAVSSSSVLNELHSDTPPIAVPQHADHSPCGVGSPLEYSHRPEDEPPSLLENFIRNRRPSISFNPEVRTDSGQHRPLEDSLRKNDFRSRQSSQYLAQPSSLRSAPSGLSQVHDFFHERRRLSHDDPHGTEAPSAAIGRPRPGALLPGVAEFAAADEELDRPTSLTSLSTASPLTDEVKTPPTAARDYLLSPLSASSARHSTSMDDPYGAWTSGSHSSFGPKSTSFSFGRHPSVRSPARPMSRRSTASCSKSPASAFLSMWSNKEEAPSPDDEGQMVGTDYVLGKQIGFGGFSTVKEAFRVEDDGETMRLAVKIVRKQVVGKSERENDQVQAEFDHEVRVWRYLHHPHILPLDAVYETDYATFCFTRLTTGGTLFDLMRKRRQGLEMSLAKRYAYQLASAIRYLHEDARVVHRDIKLENCLLDVSDPHALARIILCDFGMAEWMTTDNGDNSPDPYDNAADRPPPKNIGPSDTSTSVAGSLEYASPELILSPGGLLDPVVDIWAFGVVVYALVVGTRPFQHAFPPRVQMSILAGQWDQDAVLKDDEPAQDRRDALELIEGCLQMDVWRRWDIRRVLNCRWLRDCSDSADDSAEETPWKL